MIPEKFYQPWSEIDPNGSHGGIEGQLGMFVGPRLGDNTKATNSDLVTIFSVVNEVAASLSKHPHSDLEGPATRNMVEEVLRGINLIFERVSDRTLSPSMSPFTFTHATPPFMEFPLRPVRYGLRNEFANRTIYFMLGTLVEIAECNATRLHSNLDPSSAKRILDPLYAHKANIIKDYFDQEVAGEVDALELAQLHVGLHRPGPTVVPSSESVETPSDAAIAEALEGVDLMQWYPGAGDWAVFGRKMLEMYKAERIYQPEGSRPTTEDVSPEVPTGSASLNRGSIG